MAAMVKRKTATKRDVLRTLRPLLAAQRVGLKARIRALERELAQARRAYREALKPARGTTQTLCARLRRLEGSCQPSKLTKAPARTRATKARTTKAPALLRPGATLPAPTKFVAAGASLFGPAKARASDTLASIPHDDQGAAWDAGDGVEVAWGYPAHQQFVKLGWSAPRRDLSLQGDLIVMNVARQENDVTNPAYDRVVCEYSQSTTFASLGRAALEAWTHPEKAARLDVAIKPARDYSPDKPESFAKRVLEAGKVARRKPGDDTRALLRSVYDRGQPWGLSWEEWGEHLLQARRLGLVQLTRWDLQDDPATRDVNTVHDGPREAHLLVVEPPKAPARVSRSRRWAG
jgi:hypothetical protein